MLRGPSIKNLNIYQELKGDGISIILHKQIRRDKTHQSKAMLQDLTWFKKYVMFFKMRGYYIQYIYVQFCGKVLVGVSTDMNSGSRCLMCQTSCFQFLFCKVG